VNVNQFIIFDPTSDDDVVVIGGSEQTNKPEPAPPSFDPRMVPELQIVPVTPEKWKPVVIDIEDEN